MFGEHELFLTDLLFFTQLFLGLEKNRIIAKSKHLF